MLREQQATSSLLLQRIADIESENAERREKADMSRHTPSRSVARPTDRVLNQSATSPPVAVASEWHDTYNVTDDEDDEKYPAEDIPINAPETEIIRREQQNRVEKETKRLASDVESTAPHVKSETVPATRPTAPVQSSSSASDRVQSTVTMSSYSAVIYRIGYRT